jgi:ABC-type branched-subunit amino acid transport system substrate-binding protein
VRRTASVAAIALGLAAFLPTGAVAATQSTTTVPGTTVPATTAPTGPVGITAKTITVAGIVSADGAGSGADVGAQARIARANARGGVAGRTVQYSGTELDGGDPARDSAAVAKLRTEVFAVVPAVSPVLDTAALAAAHLAFFGPADQAAWTGNGFGFGFAGAQVPAASKTVSPAWGLTMRALLGDAKGRKVSILTDHDGAGALRAEQARVSLRAAGFTVAQPVPFVSLPATTPDLAPVATNLAASGPDAVVLLTTGGATAGIAAALAAQGYTGTVATGAAAYQPTVPTLGTGLTVLLPYAPPEQPTAANRQLLADVEKFAPGTKATPGVVAGYWAADEFLTALAKAGKRAGAAKIAATLRTFTYAMPATVGPAVFPRAHAQPAPCGALVQGDGSQYLVAVTYRCGKPVPAAPKRATTKR